MAGYPKFAGKILTASTYGLGLRLTPTASSHMLPILLSPWTHLMGHISLTSKVQLS